VAKEVLFVPEERLDEVIKVIRMGLDRAKQIGVYIKQDTKDGLEKWCIEEEDYLRRLREV
jgi:hypothetical protein